MSDLTRIVEVRRSLTSGRAKALRRSAGLSLRDIAQASGVAHTQILRWERGSVPRNDAALRYAEVLDELESLADGAV